MTAVLDKAVAKARDLAPEMQNEITRVMRTLLGEGAPVHHITPEEGAEQEAADAGEARGAYATDAEMRAIRAKHGL
jgi:hypothetical protein